MKGGGVIVSEEKDEYDEELPFICMDSSSSIISSGCPTRLIGGAFKE